MRQEATNDMVRTDATPVAGRTPVEGQDRPAEERGDLAASHDEHADDVAETNRLLTDLLATVGHDLKQPVTAVNGCLELLDRGWEDTSPEERRALVRRAATAGLRLQRLLADILAMVDVGPSAPVTQPVSGQIPCTSPGSSTTS